MKDRYSLGFKDPEVTCDILAEYPNLFPIVDHRMFGWGRVIAFALSKYEAEILIQRLQILEDYKDRSFPVEI